MLREFSVEKALPAQGTVSEVWVTVTVAEMWAPGENARLFIWRSYRDITTRKKLEDQFRQAQKMEGHGARWPEASHTIFNNIIASINGYVRTRPDEIVPVIPTCATT